MPFTSDSELDLLFKPELIPADIREQLLPDLHIRPLASSDHARSHLSVLSILTPCPEQTPAAYAAHFAEMRACPNTYFTIVIVAKVDLTIPAPAPSTSTVTIAADSIIGVGTLFVERKFTRGLSRVGHIEDIAVDPRVQGRRLGLRVIAALTGISEKHGCYKTILNCSHENIAFYEKCGFAKRENEMARYHNIPEQVHTPRL